MFATDDTTLGFVSSTRLNEISVKLAIAFEARRTPPSGTNPKKASVPPPLTAATITFVEKSLSAVLLIRISGIPVPMKPPGTFAKLVMLDD